ncbi:malonyl-CoA decarboxylase family protein [Albimonas sp. CAU 1670]|uniref:malonyl-CoA decarboxylase domain-containing protein n=1 Tax=Albimonas sp. CAU 1670 TaxID=3032599 RepID=UPI0023DAC662|nr:malonyl-CoA decarboxylase family protein [Albimonas sp. CAU 1670]MDF2234905.1 malonyl-CoA decarboxylase family protein [Albimonas sp. CAU 1670]
MPSINIDFVQDLLSALRLNDRPWSSGGAGAPDRALAEACARLMKPGGDATRIAAAAEALEAYQRLDPEQRAAFFHRLLDDYGADAEAVRAAYAAWDLAARRPEQEPAAETAEAAFARLFEAVEPRRQALLRALNLCPGGTIALVRMREDLLAAARADPSLKPLDVDFAHLFASWFNRGFLVLREIDWNTPAAILEKIVAYEAVHEIRDWDDLRRRLDPPDRRCFAFFHPATGDEPLVFVEVALTDGVPGAIAPVLEGGGAVDPRDADTAVFYSISNCQGGLRGVTFGSFLIKQVVQELSRELPNLKTFVTLSPVPGFAAWLARTAKEDPLAAELRERLAAGRWREDEAERKALAARFQRRTAQYLLESKRADARPEDPVARFHLGNGATLADVHWPADLSEGGLANGCGAMVNYLYDLDRIEARHEAFAKDGTVAAASGVKRLLKAQDKAA